MNTRIDARSFRPARHVFATCLLVTLALAMPRAVHAQLNVDVTITVDNGYGFGFGDVNGMTSYFGGIDNCTAGSIFNCGCPGPEFYPLTGVSLSGYLYIVAWSDEDVTQGVLAEFTDGTTTILSGPSQPWEVFATGEDVDPCCNSALGCGTPCMANAGPDMMQVNDQITLANNSNGGLNSSITWVDQTVGPNGIVDFGEPNDNDPFGNFQQVCMIDQTAQWMWYNPDPSIITDPFDTGPLPDYPASMSREYLIFRIGPLGDILEPSDDCEICFEFDGIVGEESPPLGDLQPPFDEVRPGEPWSIRYCFDPTVQDAFDAPNLGVYTAITSYTLTMGGASVSDSGAGLGEIRVFFDQPPGVDQYEVLITLQNGDFFFMQLDDLTGSTWTSDAMPLCGDIDLADFQVTDFMLVSASGAGGITGSIDGHDCEVVNCDCMVISDELVECDPEGSGDFMYSFDVTNLSGIDAHYLFLAAPTGVTITPDVIPLPPLLNGQTQDDVKVRISGAAGGQEVCFHVILLDENLAECCALEQCVELPCCAVKSNETLTCDPATGIYTYSVDLTNLTGGLVEHVFLVPLPGSPGTFVPDHFNVSLSSPGTVTLTAELTGVAPGDEVCFRLSVHDGTFAECCSVECCLTVPRCGDQLIGPGDDRELIRVRERLPANAPRFGSDARIDRRAPARLPVRVAPRRR